MKYQASFYKNKTKKNREKHARIVKNDEKLGEKKWQNDRFYLVSCSVTLVISNQEKTEISMQR
jgi:hypothetical protein